MNAFQSRSHRERMVALREHERVTTEACTAELARLKEAATRVQQERDDSLAWAIALTEATSASLDGELAKAILSDLYPLAKDFPYSPRATVDRMIGVWRRLSALASSELGEGEALAEHHLGIALVYHLGPDAIGAAGGREFWSGMLLSPLQRAHTASMRILEGAASPVVEEALRQLELAMASELGQRRTAPASARLEVFYRHASGRRLRAALEAFDASAAEVEHAESVAVLAAARLRRLPAAGR